MADIFSFSLLVLFFLKILETGKLFSFFFSRKAGYVLLQRFEHTSCKSKVN